jgi:hypothetical protein
LWVDLFFSFSGFLPSFSWEEINPHFSHLFLSLACIFFLHFLGFFFVV